MASTSSTHAVRLALHAAGPVRVARVVLGAVAPARCRAARAEAALEGERLTSLLLGRAVSLAVEAAGPSIDLRATSWYRQQVASAVVAAAHDAALRTTCPL